MDSINSLYNYLNNSLDSLYVLIGFWLVCAVAVFLRVVVAIGYQAQAALFRSGIKPITARAEVRDIKGGFLGSVVKDYVRIGEKSVVPDTKMLVEKRVHMFSFFGLRYKSVEGFIFAIDTYAIFLGIVLTLVFSDYKIAFALSAVLSFVILKIFAAIFDYGATRERLVAETVEYVEREIGQFYAGDFGSVVTRLKNELAAAVLRQSENVSDAIAKMGTDFSGALQLGLSEISKAVEFKPEPKPDGAQEALEAQLKFVGQNQTALDQSLQKYELALEDMARKLGDGLGSIVDFQMRESYAALNKVLEENVRRIINTNAELIERLEEVLGQVLQQSRNETQAIIQVKEQMDMQFEALKKER